MRSVPLRQRHVERDDPVRHATLVAGTRQSASTRIPEAHANIDDLVEEAVQPGGKPLDIETRAALEPRLGHDFSKVRVHTGERAGSTAAALGASAFTRGNDIVFGRNRYAPHDHAGHRLIAHELTHVAQNQATAAQPDRLLADPSAPAEAQARDVANSMAAPDVSVPIVSSFAAPAAYIQREPDSPQPPPPATPPPATPPGTPGAAPNAGSDAQKDLEEREKAAFDAAAGRAGHLAATVTFNSRKDRQEGKPDKEDFQIEGVIERPSTDPKRRGFDTPGPAIAFTSVAAAEHGGVVLEQDKFFFAAKVKPGNKKLRVTDPTWTEWDWWSGRDFVYHVHPAHRVVGVTGMGGYNFPLLTELEPDPSVAKHRAVPDVAAPPDAAGMRAIAGILPDGSKPEDQAKLPDAVDITSEEQQTTFIINYFRARGMETLQSNQEFVEGLIKSFKPTSIGAAGKPDSGVSDSAKTLIDASRRAGVLFDQVLDEEAEHEALIHWMEEKQGFIAEVFGITFQGRTQTGKQWLAEFLTERDRIKAKKNEILASAPMLAQLVELKNPKGTRFQTIPKVDLDPHVPGVSSESEYDRSLLAKPPTPENDEAIRAEFLKKLDAIHKAIHDARAQVLEGDIDFLLGLDTLRQRVKLDLGRVKGKNEGLGKQLDKMLVDKQIKDEIKTVGEFAIQIGLLFVPGGQVISAVAGFALAANELDTKLKTWDMSKAGTDPSRALADSQAADEALLNSTLKMAIQAVLLAAGVVGELRKMDGKPTPGPTDIEPPLTPAKGPPASLRDIIGEAKYKQFEEALNAVKAAHPEYADIPIDEMIAIRGYAAEDYALLNKALRAQDAAELERLSGYIQKATSGLEKLPPYAGTVNRGASMTEDMVARYVPGQTVTEAGFTSTSAKGGTPFKGNTNFIIKSKTGKDVSMISKFPKEKEILFPPGTQFKVNAVQKPAPGVNIIFLEEVPK